VRFVAGVYANVARLEVAVNNAAQMGGVDRVANLGEEPQSFRDRPLAARGPQVQRLVTETLTK